MMVVITFMPPNVGAPLERVVSEVIEPWPQIARKSLKYDRIPINLLTGAT
jgi:hypothetical protein